MYVCTIIIIIIIITVYVLHRAVCMQGTRNEPVNDVLGPPIR